MAMSITPGYDFAATGVPTRELLQLMTANMSITGIDIGQIATTILGMKVADSSASLPSEGWMWLSQTGTLWVKNRNGNIPLYRGSWGGWETNRFKAGAALDTYTLPESTIRKGELRMIPTGDTNEAKVFYQIGTNLVHDFVLCASDTLVSGTNSLLVGRGGWKWPVQTASRTGNPDVAIRTTTGGQQDQPVVSYPQTGAAQIQAIVTRQGNGATNGVGWGHGFEMHGF